jgi:ubiquinone/menaquinone biosynthesis C-methylase UbiE
MNHHDHVRLLQKGIPSQGGIWADLGSGTGAFTLALAELIGKEGMIYSIDKSASDLQSQARTMRQQFPPITVHYQTADFTKPLELPPLNGIVMANALHFIPHKQQKIVVQQIRSYLKPQGRFLLVEYNIDQGNMWVPYPLSFSTWRTLAKDCGFAQTELIGTQPSHFLREIYSAVSF